MIDFDFKIHRDIGFGFKYAFINGNSTSFTVYMKLNNFDRVEVVVDKDSFGAIKNKAKIRWLTYVSDDMSKKILVRYFENKE